MTYQPGPKPTQVKLLRENRFNQKGGKKPSTSDLRKQMQKIRPMTSKGGKRGR